MWVNVNKHQPVRMQQGHLARMLDGYYQLLWTAATIDAGSSRRSSNRAADSSEPPVIIQSGALMTVCGAWEILLGRRHRRTRRAAASRGGCPSTADEKGKQRPHLSWSQYIAHRGACRKTRVVPQNRRTCGGGKSENACVAFNVRVARGRPTAGGTRGAVADTRHAGAGVRAAGLRGGRGL